MADHMKPPAPSRLEQAVIERVCQPILRLIPESVSPNTISLANVIVALLGFLAAVVAPQLEPHQALGARIFAGFCVFAYMVLDCLDGMQARRTNRCSKLGEFIDHWLDAINLPLVVAGLILTLSLDPYSTAVAMVTSIMVYNAQLVLHHHTGRFIPPPTSGPDAQLGVAVSLAGIGLLLLVVPRETGWLDFGLVAFAWTAAAASMRNCFFYYRHYRGRRGLAAHHLKLVGLCGGFTVLYWLGMMTDTAYCIVIAVVSFRINGGYVLHTSVGRAFDGFDWALAAWVPIIALAGALGGPGDDVFGVPVVEYLPYLACLHASVGGLIEVARHFSELKPSSERAQEL